MSSEIIKVRKSGVLGYSSDEAFFCFYQAYFYNMKNHCSGEQCHTFLFTLISHKLTIIYFIQFSSLYKTKFYQAIHQMSQKQYRVSRLHYFHE